MRYIIGDKGPVVVILVIVIIIQHHVALEVYSKQISHMVKIGGSKATTVLSAYDYCSAIQHKCL